MVEISASMVKELREKSGAAMMECKKALVESQGDTEKAFEVLRQRGVAQAQKKAGRSTSEGLVVVEVAADGKSGVIIEINCETDFVARNEEFVNFTKTVASAALAGKPTNVDELLKLKAGNNTVAELLTERIAKTGENMAVSRLDFFQVKGAGTIGQYVHALGGKMGALVEIEASQELSKDDLTAVARDVAMHVVSAKPTYVSRDQVDAEVIENEKRIESGKADLAEKKAEIRDKIIQGRVDKLLAERCLLEQPFVKDPNQTIAQLLKAKGQSLGAELKPVRFASYILGETQSATNETEE